MMRQRVTVALVALLAFTMFFGALSLLEYNELSGPRPLTVSTTTVTTTATVTSIQYGSTSSTVTRGTITNGSVSVALLGSGLPGNNTFYFILQNEGTSPFGVKLVYVNGLAAYPNGTISRLVVRPNPIPPGQSGTFDVVYQTPPRFCGGDTAYFTVVTDQGVSVSDFSPFFGGITTTSTTYSSVNHISVKNASLALTPNHDQLNVTAAVAVNASAPMSRISFSIDGSSCKESWTMGAGTPNTFTYYLKDSLASIDVPIQSGKSYTVALFAQFQDGSYAMASVNATVAG